MPFKSNWLISQELLKPVGIIVNQVSVKTQNMTSLKNVLVIGSGGREHAICWKLEQSKNVSTVFAFPGSHAISQLDKIKVVKELNLKDFQVGTEFVFDFTRTHSRPYQLLFTLFTQISSKYFLPPVKMHLYKRINHTVLTFQCYCNITCDNVFFFSRASLHGAKRTKLTLSQLDLKIL